MNTDAIAPMMIDDTTLEEPVQQPYKRALSDGDVYRAGAVRHVTPEVQLMRESISGVQECLERTQQDGIIRDEKMGIMMQTVTDLAQQQSATNALAYSLVGELSAALKPLALDQTVLRDQATSSQQRSSAQQEEIPRIAQDRESNSQNVDDISQNAQRVNAQMEQLRHDSEHHVQCLQRDLSEMQRQVQQQEERTLAWGRSVPVAKEEGRRRESVPNWRAPNPDHDNTVMNGRRMSGHQAIICTAITKTPLFHPDRYDDYRKSVAWRAQLQADVSHDRLLASIGVRESDTAKLMMYDYFQAAKK